MEPICFSMSGEPIAKGRPRTTTARGFASTYTPARTRRYEASITAVALAKMAGRPPLEGPLSVSLQFRMPIPKSASKRDRSAMAAGEIAHTSLPDIDNLAKAVLDGIAAHAVKKMVDGVPKTVREPVMFLDDKQIVRLFTIKIYHERPGIDVKITPFAPQPGAPS